MSADCDRSTLKAACREAFDAGRLQGEKDAAGYEWGAAPSQTREEAFADFWEGWVEKAALVTPLQDRDGEVNHG